MHVVHPKQQHAFGFYVDQHLDGAAHAHFLNRAEENPTYADSSTGSGT